MTARHTLTLGAIGTALFAAGPALGQEMTFGDGYEFAHPAPAPTQQVVYRQEAVVQPIPVTSAPANYSKTDYGADYDVREYEVEYETTQHAPQHAPHHQMGQYPAGHGAVTYPGYPQQPPAFDRVAWLDECEARYADNSSKRKGKGGIIGGILGAATGGIIGNRVADGDRLAGSIIGAGVGGIAGLAIGSAISAAGKDRRREDAAAYCENWLARNSSGYYPQGYYPQYYQQQYILVPVTIAVPQRAVVREYVTEEWVSVPVTTVETVPARRHIKRVPAPKPVKRQSVKTVKSVKGQ